MVGCLGRKACLDHRKIKSPFKAVWVPEMPRPLGPERQRVTREPQLAGRGPTVLAWLSTAPLYVQLPSL